ncbi:hypothetical protein [Paenibacillus daejeonensis]|uniref:hypothetical protein n=1 Tax=Paenibacillus daejeonensis TaxID=135193 RepID=UPI001FE08ADB|nr:hypothetical protein [Paenibacillus daejeonensis]
MYTLQPYVNTVKKQEYWPGTQLVGHYADVYYIACHPEVEAILQASTDRLYQWIMPSLPEDICFFKKSEPWLVTVAHEQIGIINTDDPIEIDRIRAIEGIMIH